MSMMGIGSNLLGYGHPEVVRLSWQPWQPAKAQLPRRVWLAERLVALHPRSVARFARRRRGECHCDPYSSCCHRARDGGYLWISRRHDRYLPTCKRVWAGGALATGTEPNGVPRGLAGTVQPFVLIGINLNVSPSHDLAAVKMEVQRSTLPEPGFLKGGDLCTLRGIVLTPMNAPRIS